MNRELLPYALGGLLYTPATSKSLVKHLPDGEWPSLRSVCFCLEDSILDAALPRAETCLRETLSELMKWRRQNLPLLFVRVRTPEHLAHIHEMLGAREACLTGYVFPKFDLSNGKNYLDLVERINRERENPLWAMPILESRMIAAAETRLSALEELRALLLAHRGVILNVRVGGNDFCNLFGLRRSVRQTVYDLGPVRDVLMTVLNFFLEDFVVSGPVWEYYGPDPEAPWAEGLRRELALDRACGFTGKTAIHPAQLPVIEESLKVSQEDLEDALRILNWKDASLAVAGGGSGRMNEVKCHGKWAGKIAALAEIYGVRKDGTA